MGELVPDRAEAERYVEALTGDVETPLVFQTFTDADPKPVPDPLAKKKIGPLAECWPWLASMNAAGAGIFVQVNEGTGRGKKAITGLRALFIDDDHGRVVPTELQPEPSIVVQSRAGVHAYWRLLPGEDVSAFTPAQVALAAAHGTDPVVKNLDRVLRVPGFLHHKAADPFMVRLGPTSTATYSINDVVPVEAPVFSVVDSPRATTAPPLRRAQAWIAKREPATEPGRNEATFKTAQHLLDFEITDDQALDLLVQWNEGSAPPLAHEELLTVLKNALHYRSGARGTKPDRPLVAPAADQVDSAPSVQGLKAKSYASICAILRDPDLRSLVLGPGALEFDEMGLTPTLDRVPVTPEKITRVRELCETMIRDRKGKPLSFAINDVQSALLQVAHEHPFHPVTDYLRRLQWDGTNRIVFLSDVLGTKDTNLNASMLRCFMISAVARALRPGCKVDTALILVGAQGIRKSGFFKALAGDHFSDTPMTIGDKDSHLALRTSWIIEWAELESVQRAAHAHTVKAFLSSSEDTIRAPYDRATRRYPRTCVIVGSTNDQQFLTDPTGARRYWVVETRRRIDVARVEEERDQLWAEAVHLFNQGARWYLTDVEERDLRRAQKPHEVEDPWTDTILRFADAHPEGVTTEGVMDALRIASQAQNRATTMRAAAVLTRAGYQRRRQAAAGGGRRPWVYVKPSLRGGTAQVVNLDSGH